MKSRAGSVDSITIPSQTFKKVSDRHGLEEQASCQGKWRSVTLKIAPLTLSISPENNRHFPHHEWSTKDVTYLILEKISSLNATDVIIAPYNSQYREPEPYVCLPSSASSTRSASERTHQKRRRFKTADVDGLYTQGQRHAWSKRHLQNEATLNSVSIYHLQRPWSTLSGEMLFQEKKKKKKKKKKEKKNRCKMEFK